MKQSITYLKQGLSFPFWLTVILLSSLSGYVAYTPERLRATYRTEIVYAQKKDVEQVKVGQSPLPLITRPPQFNQLAARWHQCQQQVAFRQTRRVYHSIKVQQVQSMRCLPLPHAVEPPLRSFFG